MVSHTVSTTTPTAEDLIRANPLRENETRVIQETVALWPQGSVLGTATEHPKRGGPRPFGAVTVEMIWTWLPQLWEWQLRANLDPHRTMYWVMQPLDPACIVRQPYALPSVENNFRPAYFSCSDALVSGFNCILLDLDVGRDDSKLDGPQALSMLSRAAFHGSLPGPSLVALSGRGAYAIWFLRDEAGAVPANTEANHTRWRAILASLANVAEQLELQPDSQAMNKARLVKFPGTTTKAGAKVQYWAMVDPKTGKPPRYTFAELERQLGKPTPPAEIAEDDNRAIPAQVETVPDPIELPKQPRKVRLDRNGQAYGSYRHRAFMREIWHLATNRPGGIQEGIRHKTLFHYYRACRSYYACFWPGVSEASKYAREETYKLNALMSKPMTATEVEKAMVDSRKVAPQRTRVRGSTVAADLGVTAPEAELLALRTIVPKLYRDELTRRRVDSSKTRQGFYAKQREDIRETLAKHPSWTQTQVANQLGIRNPNNGSPYRQLVNTVMAEMRRSGELPSRKREIPAPEQTSLPGVG